MAVQLFPSLSRFPFRFRAHVIRVTALSSLPAFSHNTSKLYTERSEESFLRELSLGMRERTEGEWKKSDASTQL